MEFTEEFWNEFQVQVEQVSSILKTEKVEKRGIVKLILGV